MKNSAKVIRLGLEDFFFLKYLDMKFQQVTKIQQGFFKFSTVLSDL